MNINLTKITIKNYKSIKSIEIPLTVNSNGLEKDVLLGRFKYIDNNKFGVSAYVALFGRNAVGKTTILSGISFVADVFNGNLSQLVIDKIIDNRLKHEGISVFDMSKFAEINNKRAEIFNELNGSDIARSTEFMAILSEIMKVQHREHSNNKDKDIEIEIQMFASEVDQYVNVRTILNSEGVLKSEISTKDKVIQAEVIEFFKNATWTGKVGLEGGKIIDFDNRSLIMYPQIINQKMIELQELFNKDKLINILKFADGSITDVVIHEPKAGRKIVKGILSNNRMIDIMDLSAGTRQYILLAHQIIINIKLKNTLVLIDEIELSLHKELIDSLIIMMGQLFERNNTQFIFTSHSPLAVHTYTSFKQIISIDKVEDGNHTVEKLSSKFKQHQNIVNRYLDGDLAPYPDPEWIRNSVMDLFYD